MYAGSPRAARMTSLSGGADNQTRASLAVPPPGGSRPALASAVRSPTSRWAVGGLTVHVGTASGADVAFPSGVACVSVS